MTIQGIANTSKSYFIRTIKTALSSQATFIHIPLLLLASIGVAMVNIHATTIYARLQIPIKNMNPLHGQALLVFQEEMKHIQYILIDEMSFIGTKLFMHIESHLHEFFLEANNHSFNN